MKLFKKAGCILLSLVLLVSMLPMTALAEPESSLPEGFPEGYVELELEWKPFSFYDSRSSTEILGEKFDPTYYTYYYCTTEKFTKEQIPVGSVLVLAEGWRYRPEGWVGGELNASSTRPAAVTESYVVVDEAWWGDFTERAFQVYTNPSTDLTERDPAEVEAVLKIYVPAHEHNFDPASPLFCTTCGALSEAYVELTLNWETGYYGTSGTGITTASASAFASTQKFTKADLPNGSVIVFDENELSDSWRYRPATWNGTTNTTGEYVTESGHVVVDDAWWGSNTTCAFTINEQGKYTDMLSRSEDLEKAFKIYVPVHEHNFENAFCTTCGALSENYKELTLNWETGYYGTSGTGITTTDAKAYASTQKFTKETLPVGSVIVFDENELSDSWRYRPATWNGTTNTTGEYVTESGHVVVDDAWWGSNTTCAFTINEQGKYTDMLSRSEDLEKAFKIYVPVHEHNFENAFCTTCGALSENYKELEIEWQLGYYVEGGTEITTASASAFATTIDFTSTTLPVGSVIVFNKLSDNWRYKIVTRSEGSAQYNPDDSYTTESGNVVVTADWWDGIAYRAFTINEQGKYTEMVSRSEELKQAFKIYVYICPHDEYVEEVIAPNCIQQGYTKYTCKCGHSYIDENTYVEPTGQHVFENAFCTGCGMLSEDYVKLEIEWGQGYYDRTVGQDKLPEDDEFTKKFFSTQKFTKETLPVGSVIVLQPGWGCRISNWAFDVDSYQDRPNPVTATADVVYMVVTEDWWQDFDLYVFSIFEGQWAQADLTGREADVEAAFAIYVPANSEHTCVYDNACDVDCNICGETRETEHVYDNACDKNCNVCGEEREPSAHVYDNACDEDCNVCGATRETEHVYDNACDKDCNVCGEERTPSDHVYENDCDATCNECGAEREPSAHVYDNACDKDCNVCGATRETEHVYDNACDKDCNVCGEERTPSDHVYENDCDATCNECGEEREPSAHVYDHDCDKDCNVCGATRETEHVYDNACDVDCNACGATRTPSDHVYTNDCDATCNECGEEREPSAHVYDNACDVDCNVCGATRETEHVYDNACDKDCNVCGEERTPSDHVYENDCDATCNECGAEREPSAHVYDHDCDKDCNVCGATRTPSAHVYDDDIDTTCNVCGAVRVIGNYVAKIGKTYYESFAEAVAAAKNGDYIYILCDLEGEGIVIDKDINIVLGGFTYTITSGVGSEGAETGFQILEGCKVSISNGTIKVVEDLISVLIYSDADLTLRDMTLDGTNLNGNESMSCTLFIGSGNVLVNNNTTIINSADNYAISVYDGYALPTLELGSKATVEGKIYAAAKNGKYYYATLQQAIESAAYIELCRDYVGKGFVINKAVGINLAGYTITITEGVGSEGIGIQILSGNKVSFRNGTIQVADSAKDQIAILIQNYADLTITTVVLNGKNLEAASGSCILAINGGNAKVNGGSRILSSERENNNDLAVGVYADGVVQITNDVTVDGGKAEVSDRIHAIRCTNYYYGNLQNVLDKRSTAILMSDMEGAGVVINKNATIDFNGHTYTITSGVGSEGAETGFQILKGKVSFKNGTIQVADSAKDQIATIIQNDADLTITDVVIDANIGGENDSYIISVNSADGNDFSAIRFNNVTINGVKAEESVEIQAAAKRGKFYYASLEHAIAHKDKNSTKYDLILLSDVVLKDLAVIGGTKSLVLDLNSHTITADYDDSSDAFRILTTVTFKNGTVESDNGYCFIVGNETTAGKLVIVSGEYTAVDHDVFKLENGLLVDKRPREDATE